MLPGAIQIAGVHDSAEAELLVACGVDLIGLPLRLAHHAPDCTEAEAAAIVGRLERDGRARSLLITYLCEPPAILGLVRSLGTRRVQLHGAIAPEAVAALRASAPDLHVTKSLIVRGAGASVLAALEREMHAHAPHVDAFLTDTFDPSTGAEGTTGRTHDWAVSRALAERAPRPLVLAGGLTPDNVREAIRSVRPAAVDAHTGVEGADGRKRRDLVERFVTEARAGFAEIGLASRGSSRGEHDARR